ncbi:hypothetical protein IC582_029929 [Cucumis melo]
MKPLNSLCFLLLVSLELNMIIRSSCLDPLIYKESKVQLPFSPWQVTILNDLMDSTLTVHCKSKDNDLGEHVINSGDKWYWMFKENIWQTTLFWCNFRSKYGQVSGDVFWPEIGNRLSDQCEGHNCIWSGRSDGIYLYFASLKEYRIAYRWK